MSIIDQAKLKTIISQPNQNHLLRIMCYALQGDAKAAEKYLSHISINELRELERACALWLSKNPGK